MTDKKKTATKTPKVRKIRANNDAPVATPMEAVPIEAPAALSAAKPKREKAPKEDLMTFAFRMPKAESARLHLAAGPANASRTMRALAAAFVAEDRGAFEAVVEDARKLRA